MTITSILSSIESTIKSQEERAYFLIHEARYKRILKEITKIVDHRSSIVDNSKQGKNSSFLRSKIYDLKSTRILDVGCYPYHLGAALEKMGHEVWGISSTHEPIKNKHIAILNIETDAFPYKDNTFDLVLCSEVLEHLPHSPIPAIREMYRVTKPGGHVLITTPNIVRSINQGKMLLGRSPTYSIDAFLENEGKGSNLYHRHNREYTLNELTKIVSTAGFTIAKSEQFISYHPFRKRNRTDHPLLWLGKFMNYLLMLAVPGLQDTLLVIGRKSEKLPLDKR